MVWIKEQAEVVQVWVAGWSGELSVEGSWV
jgi:hypothetical protein